MLTLRKLGKQERRSTGDGRFLKRSLRHEPRRKRMKLVEPYLVCGSIAETPQGVCLFPPLVLDRISADWALAWALRGGNDLLAHYRCG